MEKHLRNRLDFYYEKVKKKRKTNFFLKKKPHKIVQILSFDLLYELATLISFRTLLLLYFYTFPKNIFVASC